MPSPPTKARDESIDFVRGVVMVLMVLDHARDFATSNGINPTDPARASFLLFFTRFITHYCAPVFVLLAGTGAGISSARGKSTAALRSFLVTRGLWLVVLELTWVRFGWMFELSYRTSPAQVIWALGWSMVLLGILLPLGPRVLAVLGAVIVVGHNALDGVHPEQLGAWGNLWRVLHGTGNIELDATHKLRIAYAIFPWVGVMMLGYAMGRAWSRITSRALLLGGSACVIAFVILRGLANVYGDPVPWVSQASIARSFLAILNCNKYPPSLDYLLVTLGPTLIALGALRGRALTGVVARVFLVFGKVPLFFYLLHLPLVHAITLPLRAHAGLPLVAGAFAHGLNLSLGCVYAIWLGVIVILWLPCKAWAKLKSERRDWWLSYL